ncbi:uncharacterized protein UV8b_00393 [Ustilaginoidea virens]|uniref:Uncharacterized protein n=1 Tax=Ustilaginoidea virens TaxID=1159556 RepID=A0A063BXW1_USTVR|nr:uncharacterized protein UV8b_00393 [Ustilaginoidea virens]QUC16152.1 hypothetical protein UV8b_00393 [Ustilaginoidea virens]GAO17916.1 hypothetical protein UVI_02027050 [Ustilaginoidea virens]
MDEDDAGILNMQLSDDDVDVAKKKADRTGQAEDDFQATRRRYRVKVENGDMHKHVRLPLEPGASKMRTQQVIHAVEELYFYRQYHKAADLVARAFANGGREAIDDDSRRLLDTYRSMCLNKSTLSSSP